MDPLKNPFSPGAGAPPPELVGRDPVLEQARILLGRIKQKKPEKSLLLTGLRGVGKTVLLNAIERMARAQDYRTIVIETYEGARLGPVIAPKLRAMLYELDLLAGAGNKVKRGLAVLRSFVGSLTMQVGDVTLGLDIEPEKGAADSGDIEIDLPNLFVAVAEAAEERQSAIAIFMDEVQYFSQKEIGALIMAMHRVQQLQLPLLLVGAGLPILPALAGESKSYAERLFAFPAIDALSAPDAAKALNDPVQPAGVVFDQPALDKIHDLTQGYPYFIQEWGYQCWNHATASPITLETVRNATAKVIPRLDANFFRVRFGRLTPGEKHFLRAIAQLGSGPQRTGEVAETLGVTIKSLGPIRAKLINKGMIYSPAHGDVAFTVPLFDEFMRRTIPHWPEIS